MDRLEEFKKRYELARNTFFKIQRKNWRRKTRSKPGCEYFNITNKNINSNENLIQNNQIHHNDKVAKKIGFRIPQSLDVSKTNTTFMKNDNVFISDINERQPAPLVTADFVFTGDVIDFWKRKWTTQIILNHYKLLNDP